MSVKKKYKLTLDVEFEFDPTEHPEWRLNKQNLKRAILSDYFYYNGVELNQDIKIEEITDEAKNQNKIT